jgi:hypothetical protein
LTGAYGGPAAGLEVAKVRKFYSIREKNSSRPDTTSHDKLENLTPNLYTSIANGLWTAGNFS